MKRQIKYILLAVCTLLITKTFAQADISMATHWYNRADYNPASIAKPDYIYLFTNARQQWNEIEGAPQVFNAQVSGYIPDMRSAFGLSLVSDQIGVSQALNPMLTYAFRIEKDEDWSLSMGLAGGVFTRSMNGSDYLPVTITDPSLYYDIEKVLKPDANFGVEFQSSRFVFGLSSTHLFAIGRSDSIYLNTNHRYGYAIYKNTDSELFNYNFGLQLVNKYNLTVLEGNAAIRIKRPTGLKTGPKELFYLGLTYRTSKQMTCLFGVNITSNFRIGYAYDQSFISSYSMNNTNEIVLELRIPSSRATSYAQKYNEVNWYY